MSYTWSAGAEERARKLIAAYPQRRSAIMALLYIAMQEDLDRGKDRLTDDGMRKVADLAGVTPAQVVAVASFYTMYKRSPVGRYLVSVCTSLSCWLGGADDVLHAIEDEVGAPSGHVDGEGLVSPEHVECIGACGAAPTVQVNYEFVEGVTPDRAREMVRWLRSERPEQVTGDELQARFGGDTSFPWGVPDPVGATGPVPAFSPLGTAAASPDGADGRVREPSPTTGNGDAPMILTARMNDHPRTSHALATYEATGGYSALRKVLGAPGMSPGEITAEVKGSMLRGRGGAGFPAGVKWGFLAPARPSYLVVNADESEPGTFKDRQLMERDPHQMIEGVVISSYASEAHHAFVYIRGEYPKAARRVQAAVEEAYAAGYLGRDILGSGYDLDVTVHLGAGAYICGEETGLLNSLEGRRGEPRLKPPYFPAAKGLYMMPTIVNNVETLANIPWIINHGGAAYAAIGPPGSPGRRMCSISGHVNRPGNYEIVEGLTWRDLIFDLAGGIRNGNRLKAWVPGGALVALVRSRTAPRHRGDQGGHRRPRFDDGFGGGDRHGPHHRRGGGGGASGSFLRPRVLRPVHPVPGGHCLAGPDPAPHHGRPGACGGRRPAARRVRQHFPGSAVAPRHDHDLPARSIGRLARGLSAQVLPGRGGQPPPAGQPGPGGHRRCEMSAPDRPMVRLNIDGEEVEARAGELLIKAAEDSGTYIPRFCWHPRMNPVGMCRMCLVEIETPRGRLIIPSCTQPVNDGMVAHTESEAARKAQEGVLEFLLLNHPLDCPVCDKGGELPPPGSDHVLRARGEPFRGGEAPLRETHTDQ